QEEDPGEDDEITWVSAKLNPDFHGTESDFESKSDSERAFFVVEGIAMDGFCESEVEPYLRIVTNCPGELYRPFYNEQTQEAVVCVKLQPHSTYDMYRGTCTRNLFSDCVHIDLANSQLQSCDNFS
ncbi:hypothetical protein PENTCL1PPCAC_8661, partial [Pristionchus entomophagus]